MRKMKARGVKREGSRGGEEAGSGLMNHYKGKEKSKWKRGATKEYSSLPLDEFECKSWCVWGKRERERGGRGFNYTY